MMLRRKCLVVRNGWQASETCAEAGVYYLYRFNEDGNDRVPCTIHEAPIRWLQRLGIRILR